MMHAYRLQDQTVYKVIQISRLNQLQQSSDDKSYVIIKHSQSGQICKMSK